MTIYLDYNATTPVDPTVLDAMLPYFTERHGNAASVDHTYGHQAMRAVEDARASVASLIGAEPDEIIFASGATEADNIAVLGTTTRASDDSEVVTSAIEHPAVLGAARALGERVRIVPVDGNGVVDPDDVQSAISSRTALVSVMCANNETGAIQPVAEIGAICAEAGVTFHTDAVQAVSRIGVNVQTIGAGLLSISGHKMYGPKGVGALFVRRKTPRPRLRAIMWGGGHERNLRPGTLNVPAIVGLGVAAERALSHREADAIREQHLRQRLLDSLLATDIPLTLTTDLDFSLPQTLNLRFLGIDASALMRLLSGKIAIATGSACSTTSVEPSHVLIAQGLSPGEAGESVRISLGRPTTEADVDEAARYISEAITRLNGIPRRAAA